MSCKTQKKRLDTLKKRKRVIHNLFKKDKKTGQILLKITADLLYEKPGEKLRKNIDHVCISQIESIDKNYSDIYLKQILFGPPRESFAPGATLETNPITKRYHSTRLMHITYNKDLDVFNVTIGIGDNTYNSFGQFNHSKKFFIDIWENEDARSLTNSVVGRGGYINITSDKLPKDISETVTENSFDEIYKQVWDNNHEKFDKELLINNFVGSWNAKLDVLYSNPNTNNSLANVNLVYTIEKPLYVNKSKTIAIGRCIQTFTNKDWQTLSDAGADGNTAKNSFNHSIISYSMTWIEQDNVFRVKFVDMDDTSIGTLTYNEKGIIGDVLETPNNDPESNGSSLGKGNGVVGGLELTKITELPFKPPTYNELYAELKEKELLLEKSFKCNT